jgi:hypothetical protein
MPDTRGGRRYPGAAPALTALLGLALLVIGFVVIVAIW